MLLNHEEFTEMLVKDVILVNFTKVNGEKRDLRCTLKPDLLPVQTESTKSNKTSSDKMNVWDVDNDSWRSFRLDSVNHVFDPAPKRA